MYFSTSHFLPIFLLSAYVAPTLAGNCLSAPRDPNDRPPLKEVWTPCKHRPKKWACEDRKIDFPTVECLRKDMQTCGNVGTGPRIFYSFGAKTVQVRKPVRDTKNPKGVMWNDALDNTYTDMLHAREKKFRLGLSSRQKVYNARYAEAFASLTKGEVFFGVANYTGSDETGDEGPGGHGAYQNVKRNHKPEDNVWLQYEFPTLQHKSQATKVTTFSVSNGSYNVDWERRKRGKMLEYKDTSKLPVPPVTKRSAADETICPPEDDKDKEKEECDE